MTFWEYGPGGIGKSFIIATLVRFANNFGLCYDILCPTQFDVQNAIKMCQNIEFNQPNSQTIHSFFNLQINKGIKANKHQLKIYLAKRGILNFNSSQEMYIFIDINLLIFQNLLEIFRKLDIIVIEEVSMMDPQILTLLDIYGQITRQCAYPFGGIQVFLFGDSIQLSPVLKNKSNYFDSHVFNTGYFSHIIELNQSVRQADDIEYFNNILQTIRFGTLAEDSQNFYNQIQKLEQRIVPYTIFNPNQKIKLQKKIKRSFINNFTLFKK